jgi:hypothetical protein
VTPQRPARRAAWTYVRTTISVPQARRWLIRTLRAWGIAEPAHDPLALIASELVTHVVRHGAGPTLDLEVCELGDACVTVTVIHDGAPWPTARPRAAQPADRGVGLYLVAVTSHRCGAPPHRGGQRHRIWACVDTRQPSTPGPALCLEDGLAAWGSLARSLLGITPAPGGPDLGLPSETAAAAHRPHR